MFLIFFALVGASKIENQKIIKDCKTTNQNCASCQTGNDASCETCKDGYYLKDGENGNKICSSCAEGCQKCSTENTCSKCKDEFELKEGKCEVKQVVKTKVIICFVLDQENKDDCDSHKCKDTDKECENIVVENSKELTKTLEEKKDYPVIEIIVIGNPTDPVNLPEANLKSVSISTYEKESIQKSIQKSIKADDQTKSDVTLEVIPSADTTKTIEKLYLSGIVLSIKKNPINITTIIFGEKSKLTGNAIIQTAIVNSETISNLGEGIKISRLIINGNIDKTSKVTFTETSFIWEISKQNNVTITPKADKSYSADNVFFHFTTNQSTTEIIYSLENNTTTILPLTSLFGDVDLDGKENVPNDGQEEKQNDGQEEKQNDGQEEKQNDGQEEKQNDGQEEKQNDGQEEKQNDGQEEKQNDGQEEKQNDGQEEKQNDGQEEKQNDGQEEKQNDGQEEKQNDGQEEKQNDGQEEKQNDGQEEKQNDGQEEKQNDGQEEKQNDGQEEKQNDGQEEKQNDGQEEKQNDGQEEKQNDGQEEKQNDGQEEKQNDGQEEKQNDGQEEKQNDGQEEKQNDGQEEKQNDGQEEKQNDGQEEKQNDGQEEKQNDGQEEKQNDGQEEKQNDGQENGPNDGQENGPNDGQDIGQGNRKKNDIEKDQRDGNEGVKNVMKLFADESKTQAKFQPKFDESWKGAKVKAVLRFVGQKDEFKLDEENIPSSIKVIQSDNGTIPNDDSIMRPGGEVTTNTDTSTNTDGGRNEEDSTKPTEQRKKGLTGGAIAGIVISCVVVVAGICVSVFFIIIKNKKAPVCAKP